MRLNILAITILLISIHSCQAIVSADETLAPTQEKTIVSEIYALTKTAKTAQDYSALIAKCQSAFEKKLSDKNRAYLKRLCAWSMNRRGELRLELAETMKISGNQQAVDLLDLCITDFKASIDMDGKRDRAWMCRGIANFHRDRIKLAMNDLNKAIEINPNNLKAIFNRAEISYQQKDYEAAMLDYETCLKKNSVDLAALTGKAHCKYAMARYPEAVGDYNIVCELQPDNANAFLNRGDAMQMLGKWPEAISDYEKSISLKATGIAYQRLGWTLATCPEPDHVNVDRAIEMAQKAILENGETAKNLDTLAAAQAASGNFNAAKLTQQKAIKLNEANGDLKQRLDRYANATPFLQNESKSKVR